MVTVEGYSKRVYAKKERKKRIDYNANIYAGKRWTKKPC